MTRFAYKAIPTASASGRAGAMVEGRDEASDERSLRDRLRRQGLIPIEVRPVSRADAVRVAMRGDRVRPADRAWFFRTLRQMLDGKAPIETAVSTMQELAPKPRLAEACGVVREALRSGSSLADAVEKSPGLADAQSLALLRVGHEAGRLRHAVELIDRSLAQRQRLRKTIVGRLSYPAMVLGVAVLAVFVLSSFVIPSFAKTLVSVGAELPLSTRITLAASEWIVWAVPALVVIGVGLALVRPARLSPGARRRVQGWAMRAPVAGSLLWHGQAAVVSDTLATIIEGGGDVLVGLEQSGRAVWSDVVRERLEAARKAVREGAELGEALSEHRVLPPMVAAVVRVGMRSGDLVGALRRATDLCVEKQEETTSRLLTLLEPATILVLATVVGWVFYSLIAGILTMNEIGSMT